MCGKNTLDFEKNPELRGWKFIYSGMKSKANAGVGIALSPDVELVDIDNILNGRILLVRCILHGIKISAFCAYAQCAQKAIFWKKFLILIFFVRKMSFHFLFQPHIK